MPYSTKGKTYLAVCAHIGWDSFIHAVQVMSRGNTVYATGTLLKPAEWRLLAQWDWSVLPDGRILRITYVPWGRL